MINEEYETLKRMTRKTPEQWMRQNVLLEEIQSQKGIIKGVYNMSQADLDVAIQKYKDEEKKRKEDCLKYRNPPKHIPGEKEYDPDYPSFGEE